MRLAFGAPHGLAGTRAGQASLVVSLTMYSNTSSMLPNRMTVLSSP